MLESMNQKVIVYGLGYIGLPTAALLASWDHKVTGVDTNPEVVEKVNQGIVHIAENDLENLVQDVVARNLLRASNVPVAGDVHLIAVPTPFSGDGCHTPDVSFVTSVARDIAGLVNEGDLVILESTSPVGTTRNLNEIISALRPDLPLDAAGLLTSVDIAYCPERVLPGDTLNELVHNSRIVGGLTVKASNAARNFYSGFVEGDLTTVQSPEVAELTKLAENAYRDVNIAFANELSLIGDELEVDVREVISAANLHPRVNILSPGVGVGGHCIAVDPWFIVHSSPTRSKLIAKARQINDSKPDWVIARVKKHIQNFVNNTGKTPRNVTIAGYGLSYKPDIDDMRESPALLIQQRLSDWFEGEYLVVDPYIEQLDAVSSGRKVDTEEAMRLADLHFIFVEHREFAVLEVDDASVFRF